MKLAVSNPPRTLANVLLDIGVAASEVRTADRMCAFSELRSPEEEHWSDRAAAADDRLDAYRAEAKSMIEAATGVTWEQIEGANL